MKLGLYEWLIIGMLIALVVIFIFTLISKWRQDRLAKWRKVEKDALTKSIRKFLSKRTNISSAKKTKKFIGRLEAYAVDQRHADLIESVLFDFMEFDEVRGPGARIIGQAMNFPPKSIKNLQARRAAKVLHGCMQARYYVYRPAIPYLLQCLSRPSLRMQYDILMTLARFDDPDIIVQAFDIIKDAIQINERSIREIVKWMSDANRTVLFDKILDIKSEHLSTLFLKFMDQGSANALKEKIIPLANDDQPKELRIAAVKGIAATKNPALVPRLIEALKDPEWELRTVAASGLGGMQDERAIAPLLEAICDRAWWVRQNAATALLSFPDSHQIITKVIEANDRYAYESLCYAADIKGKGELVKQIAEELNYDPVSLSL